MEIGLRPQLDKYQDTHEVKITTVQESANSNVVHSKKDMEDVFRVSANERVNSTNEIKEQNKEAKFKEVEIANINFGYNPQSEDFYVKVKRGDSVYQYPTEDMMRIKAQLKEVSEESLKEARTKEAV